MHPVIAKTLGGLSLQYFLRQFVFGLAITAFVLFCLTRGGGHVTLGTLAFLAINTLLYPYARFVYETIVDFILGDNFFLVNGILLLVTKLFTMILCWCCAIFIAPFGLAYLFYLHSKGAPEESEEL